MACNSKMVMFFSNYELFLTRNSNVFVCHPGVSKSTIYEKDPAIVYVFMLFFKLLGLGICCFPKFFPLGVDIALSYKSSNIRASNSWQVSGELVVLMLLFKLVGIVDALFPLDFCCAVTYR